MAADGGSGPLSEGRGQIAEVKSLTTEDTEEHRGAAGVTRPTHMKSQIKGGGQECPPHTQLVIFSRSGA